MMTSNVSTAKIAESARELVEVLQTSFTPNVGNYHPSYFYYTTISTLSRILGNGLLRLTNIQSTRLNDFREPREFGPSKMWRRICIGCFSADRMENNAMWSAYGRPETEAIVIRIPSRVMEEMCKSPVFVDRRMKRNKFSALDETSGIEDELIRVLRIKCLHHDVAYFPNIVTGEEDKQERKDAIIKLYRDYSECANIHVRLHGASPKELDPLVGYVKRWQWMYERESRLRVLLPEKYAGHTAYLKLPEDFFDRVGIVFGPAFDASAPFARETLRKFLDVRRKNIGNFKPFTESAYTNVLNYDRKTVGARSRISPLLTYKGQIVSRHSPQGESLSARYLRFGRDAFEDECDNK